MRSIFISKFRCSALNNSYKNKSISEIQHCCSLVKSMKTLYLKIEIFKAHNHECGLEKYLARLCFKFNGQFQFITKDNDVAEIVIPGQCVIRQFICFLHSDIFPLPLENE